MGVIYMCIPLTREPELTRWLAHHHLQVLETAGPSRHPTLLEVRQVLDALTEYTIHYVGGDTFWQADIAAAVNPENGMSTTIIASCFTGDEGRPQRISFGKGSPELIIRIMADLAQACGPLICFPDTGDIPIIVTADTKSEQVLGIWSGGCF